MASHTGQIALVLEMLAVSEMENQRPTRDEQKEAKPIKKPCITLRDLSSLDSQTPPESSPDSASSPALDDLLSDIRRSRTTSLASTPSAVSSDGEVDRHSLPGRLLRAPNTGEELREMNLPQLRSLAESTAHDVARVSDQLVRLLHIREKRDSKLAKHCNSITTALRDRAEQDGVEVSLQFSLDHPESKEDHMKWLTAWKALSRVPIGVPRHLRKKLWCSLAEHGTHELEWPNIFQLVFSEYSTPEDETLGSQIVKDLHRTGNAGFTTEEEHVVLKRVLLAYARFNKSTGYCQGFNIIAALILRVVNFEEEAALKVMVYLVDHILPSNYFAQNLYALSVDMAVFRDLLHHFLPELSTHMDRLRRKASGGVRTSYSRESPPDESSICGFEPPLADVFSMQWFLTLFATSLPKKATRRVWDAILLEGSDMLIYTAIAFLTVLERELLKATTAADFYSLMAQLGDKMRKAYILPSNDFMQIIYATKDTALAPDSGIPNMQQLRERYTYNIYPCAPLPAVESASVDKQATTRLCPRPSRGGSFLPIAVKHSNIAQESKIKVQVEESGREGVDTAVESTVEDQIRRLHEHYAAVARQPSVSCDLDMAMPQARVVCPQIGQSVFPLSYTMSYAADVPTNVLQHSKLLSHCSTVDFVQQHCSSTFTLQSFPGSRPHPLHPRMDQSNDLYA